MENKNISICKQFRQGMRLVRKAKDISLDALAKKTGISINHLSHIETGKAIPTLGMVERICEGLEISGNELFKFGNI